jgi:hypothetical protein
MVSMRILALPLALALAVSVNLAGSQKEKKPKISVKANPVMAISPARIVVSADVNGGPDDYEDFYCATAEWDWGDDTRSQNTIDCEPYEAGKSQIKRRFTTDHVYRTAGEFRIQFRLKKKDKVMAGASTSVRIRPGLGDGGSADPAATESSRPPSARRR